MRPHHDWPEKHHNTPTATASNSLPEPASDELKLERAQILLLHGKLDQAEQILTPFAQSDPTPAALDLLARIYIQTGRQHEAKALWEVVLRHDAGNVAARNALHRLSSPWGLVAAARRFALLVFIAIVSAMCGLGVLTISRVSQENPPSITPVPAMTEHGTLHLADEPGSSPSRYASARQTTVAPAPDEPHTVPDQDPSTQEPAPDTPLPQAMPSLVIAGCTIITNAAEIVLVFNEGLFGYRCELTETGNAVLGNLAAALAECPPVVRLLVEGHTDNDPMPTGGPFPSNYALGFARAATVADRLKGYAAIPAQTIVASSLGSDNPPFPNEDYDSRLRNRTVVLKIRFADATEGQEP